MGKNYISEIFQKDPIWNACEFFLQAFYIYIGMSNL